MLKDNKNLLNEVIRDRLEKALGEDPEAAKLAFEEAMAAIDRQSELDKNDVSKSNGDKDRLVKVVEIGLIAVAAPLVEAACKKGFAQMICEFEKNDSFTTMAGKSLSSLFKFRK